MYRKFSADFIFNGYEFLQNQVLVTDAAGVIIEIVDEAKTGEGIESFNGILCPGFINAHCHLELSHMKGVIPKHTGLHDFILKVVNHRYSSEEIIMAAIEKAEDEMLRNGIVAVGDICNNTLTIPQKIKGRIAYYNFIEVSGFPPAEAALRFNTALDLYKDYAEKFSANSIVPHAPYSVSTDLLRMINDFRGNKLITIHNQETAAENEFFQFGTGDFTSLYRQMGIDISFFKSSGQSSVQTWLPNFAREQSIILVHNVCTSGIDLEFIKRKTQNSSLAPEGKLKTYFCLCPNANVYISNELPDINLLNRYSDNIVLGTDSLASNDQLSILEEMKTLQYNYKEPDLQKLLQWATSNGSRALQMEDTLGSFEKGKKPGVILLEGIKLLRLDKHTSVKRIL